MNNKQPLQMRKILGLIFIICLFFTGCSNSSSDANSNNSEINRDLVPPPIDLVEPVRIENTDDNINKDNFDKIKIGMSQTDVEILIAGDSKIMSNKNANGKYTETTRWETANSAKYIEVSFENNQVVSKKEKGLK
jgi:PBP1b-binding outer membrane lipoprotein LpoB